MDFQAKEWSFLFRNGLIEHIGCKAGAMALSFIQCSHSHKILIFLSYYIHCYVFQLVCQYDDIPLASLIYCKRTFFSDVQNVRERKYPSVFLPCSMHQCVYSVRKKYTSISVVEFLPQCVSSDHFLRMVIQRNSSTTGSYVLIYF